MVLLRTPYIYSSLRSGFSLIRSRACRTLISKACSTDNSSSFIPNKPDTPKASATAIRPCGELRTPNTQRLTMAKTKMLVPDNQEYRGSTWRCLVYGSLFFCDCCVCGFFWPTPNCSYSSRRLETVRVDCFGVETVGSVDCCLRMGHRYVRTQAQLLLLLAMEYSVVCSIILDILFLLLFRC